METEFSQFEFEKLVRSSYKHGWLNKRSNGFKAVIPRKRYFVLCDDSLYWFKKEKNLYIRKGTLDLVDMKITDSKSPDALQIEKKSNGKVYILSGTDLNEWAKTLAATLLPLSTIPHELKLSDYGSEDTSKSSGKLSRKSTGASSGLSSSGLSSLPTSNASSLVDGESNPPTPQADLEDSSSLDDNLIGRPLLLTEETLEKHNSTMDSIQDVMLTKESLEKHNETMDSLQDTYRVDITRVDTPEDSRLLTPSKSIRDAISFFETLAKEEDPVTPVEAKRTRRRFFSSYGPETKSRLKSTPHPASPKSIGGADLPSEQTLQFDEDSSTSSKLGSSESSLLSEEIAKANLQGSRTLDELADSLANMMGILDSLNDTIESQTQTNLFLFERGRSLLPPVESETKKRLVSVTSEPTLLRIPSDRESEMGGLRKMSSYRLSVDYRARRSTAYSNQKSAMSCISLHTAESDSVSSLPDVEDITLECDERFADIEEYIHSRLICKEPISMVDLTNCFKGKRLPKLAFRKLYSKIRKRVEVDRRISRRQPENLSQLSLLYGHFVDLHSGEIEEEGIRELLDSKYIQRKFQDDQLDLVQNEILIPMDFKEFTNFLNDLPSEIGFQLRLGLEEHVKAKSPLRRVNLRLSEVELIDFEDDGLTVKRSALSCVEKGWSLAKLGGETIFTSDEKEDYLDDIEDTDLTFDLDFIASIKD